MPHDIPEKWIPCLRAFLLAKYGKDREYGLHRCYLSASDFSPQQSVLINFPDGSFAFFRYGFAVWNETGDECAVFTEHCGYDFLGVTRDEVTVVAAVPEPAGR